MGTILSSLLMAASLAAPAMLQAQDEHQVWVWTPQCPSPTKVVLDVRLDGKSIYSTSIPLCRWKREFEEGKASFRFTPARPLIWYGYRSDEGDTANDPGDTTTAGATLEVEFWQAGGETDAIELGYSVADSGKIYTNSIHMLSLTRRSLTTMAPGLILETSPEKEPPPHPGRNRDLGRRK